jgi:ABC-type lipoprotein release transport system permease subunit
LSRQRPVGASTNALETLRGMGMTGRQVRWSVLIAGLSIAVVGVVIGLPVGVALGGSVWRLVASTAYVGGDPAWGIALVVVPFASIAVGAALSLLPAYRTTRHLPGWALRSE